MRASLHSPLLHQVITITSCGLCLILGVLIFSRGYLLNRKVIAEKSVSHNAYNSVNSTSGLNITKMVFVLVDALRYDFIRRMQFLSHQCESGSVNGKLNCCVLQCIADPPTTTMQRLKALTTGTMPTFVDVSANFNSYEIEEDSLIYQLDRAGYKIGFLGDDTWLNLFPHTYFKGIVEGHPSFNAWDLDTVDYAINATVNTIFKNPAKETNWGVLIIHYLGIDHCGHRYGPNHVEMQRKLDETDAALRLIYSSMDSNTLLVIVGDHGMTETGDHGGDSKDEVQAGLIFLAKDNPMKCHSQLKNPVSVSQVDLVPTLATIFRLPIPFSSLGEVIPAVIDEEHYLEALLANVIQVQKYIEAYGFKTHSDSLTRAFEDTIAAYEQLKSKRTPATADAYKQLATSYLGLVKRIATSTWTNFDHVKMLQGISICCLSLMGLCLSTVQQCRPDVLSQLVNAFPLISIIICIIRSKNSSVFGLIFVSLFVLVLRNSVQYFRDRKERQHVNVNHLDNASQSPVKPIYTIVLAVLLYLFTCLGVLSNSFVINEGYILGTTLAFLLLTHCLLSKSTVSFKVRRVRDKLGIIRKYREPIKWNYWSSWIPFLGVLMILRTSHIFFRCREELQNCSEEFLLHKPLASLPSDWIVHKYIRYSVALISLAVLVVSLRSFMLGRKCILSSRPCSVIGKYIPSVLVVLLCVHWALQGLLFGQLLQIQIRPLIQYFPLMFQVLAIGSLITIWWKPLCCIGVRRRSNESRSRSSAYTSTESEIPYEELRRRQVEVGQVVHDEEDSCMEPPVESLLVKDLEKGSALDERSGFIHGSSLLTYAIILTLLLAHVTSVGLAPVVTFIPYTIAGLVIIHGDSNSHSWAAVICWTLASQFFFYATGHQPIFSSIPWDSAFTSENANSLSDGQSSWINWIQPAVSVLSNLYGSQILFSVMLGLLVFWKGIQPGSNLSSQLQMYQMLNLCAKFLVLHGLKLLSCMLCVTIHRRHLMVWKIFTPRLIFEGVAFIVIYLTLFTSVLLILRVQFVFKEALVKRNAAVRATAHD